MPSSLSRVWSEEDAILPPPPPAPPPLEGHAKGPGKGGGGLSTGDYQDLVSPSPSPPPPPVVSPPLPPARVIGEDIGLVIHLTGDPYMDARETSLVSMLTVMRTVWMPPILSLAALTLFLLHNGVINLPETSRILSTPWRHALNVFACACGYILCAWCNLIFNKLVLIAVPLPAFVGCVQMG